MNKIETINQSISEIREILGAECANISELPDIIRTLTTDTSKNGYTTAFVFSSENNPNIPTSEGLDPSTGLVIGLSPEWSQTGFQSTSTYSLRRTVNNDGSANWMSFAIFDPAGVQMTEWSSPTNLKGSRGEQGIPGETGAKGDKGEQGPKGDSSSSYRTVSVYTMTEDITTPSRPEGGSWDLATNTVIPPSSNSDKYKWYLNADEPPKSNYLWMSQVTFGEDGNPLSNWCTPFRLTGEAGKSGADGRVTEFIYRLLPDLETYNELSKYLAHDKLYSPKYEDDVIPEPNDNLNIGTRWSDQPKGISEIYPIEVCCTRTRKGVEESWSEWSNCIIWSKWGEDGMDGDGVEYIYLVTPDETNEGEPMTSDHVAHYFTPNRTDALNDKYYQQDEFCFNYEWGYAGYDWKDEPLDVGPDKPLEWVMIRKKKKNSDGKVVWGEFSDPAIWGRFAEDGLPYLTSFVFTRSIENPGQPSGGSYENPKPNQSIWSDTIPAISETMKGPVWMSSRVFYAGNENTFDKDWTAPKIIADTHDFQVEYSTGNENGLVPYLDPFTGDEETWRTKQELEYGIKWGDDSQITDPTWMITTSCDNGVWKPWVLTKIKGERGPAGKNGASVEVRGKFPTLEAIKEEWREYAEDGSDFHGSMILNNGDAYFVEESGMLYIYNGGFYTGEATTFELYWAEVQLTGEKGDSFYFYVAYCETLGEGATLYFDTPKKYIGTIISETPLESDYLNKWSSYKNWTQWLGEDGWGQEQIFLLTSKNADYNPVIAGKKPLLPINEDGKGNEKEYLPPHGLGNLAKGTDEQPDRWADSPLTVSEDYPYCWVVSRSATATKFGNWKGDGAYAALYSRYSYDGLDGKSPIAINLTNDLVVIPMVDNLVDPDFIIACADNPITTGVQVFIGDDPVDNESYGVVKSEYFTVNNELDTLTLNVEKVGNVKEIPVTITVGSNEYKTTWKILKTDAAYELEPSLHVIKRYSEGNNAGSLENPEFTVKVWKWSDNKWIASGKAVFAKVSRGTSEKVYSNTDGSGIVSPTTNGIVTVNLSGIKDVTGIRLFVTSDDIGDETNALSFEDIAIVADGVTGATGEDGVGIESVVEKYLATSYRSGVTSSNGVWGEWQEDVSKAELSKEKQFLWNYTIISYTKGNSTETDPCVIGKWSADGKGIESIVEYYAINNDADTAPTSWSIDVPIPTSDDPYLWNYEVINYTEGDPKITAPCIIGFYGKGDPGNPGASAIHLELTNDSETIFTDSDGNISPNFNQWPETEGYLYEGGIKVDPSEIVYTYESSGCTIDDTHINYGHISLSSISEDKATVTLFAEYKNVKYSKIFTVTKSFGSAVYKIICSEYIINVDDKPQIINMLVHKNGYNITDLIGSEGYDYHLFINGSEFIYSEHKVNGEATMFGIIVDLVGTNEPWEIKLYNGDVLLDSETIGLVKNGESGRGIIGVIKQYEVGNDSQNHPTFSDSSTTDPSTLTTNYDTARFIWCKETIKYTSGDPDERYYIVTVHGEPGAAGTGADAPIIYPAGVWNSTTEYRATTKKVPYVWFDDSENSDANTGYYMMTAPENGEVSSIGEYPYVSDKWEKMESFEAIYADVGVLNQALVGKWVFHGDYMFSQEGTRGENADDYLNSGEVDGTSYQHYDDLKVAIENNGFIPNICLNAVTGDSWFAGKSLQLDSGSIKMSGVNTSIQLNVPISYAGYEADVIINKDGFSYSFSAGTNNINFEAGKNGISLFNGEKSRTAVEFKVGSGGLELTTYSGGVPSKQIYTSDNKCYIGDFLIFEGGLKYEGSYGLTISPNFFSCSDEAGLVQIMHTDATECIYINPQFTKTSTTNPRTTAIKAVDGVFEGLRPKVRYVTLSAELDEFDHTVVAENKDTIIWLPSSPLIGQEYIIICVSGGVIVKSEFNNVFQVYSANTGQSISYEARAAYHVVYVNDKWYATPIFLI